MNTKKEDTQKKLNNLQRLLDNITGGDDRKTR